MKHNFNLQLFLIYFYQYHRSNISSTCLPNTYLFISVLKKKLPIGSRVFPSYYIQIHTNTIACINKIHWKKDGINRLQFLASVEEKSGTSERSQKKLSGMWRVVYFDVLEIQSSHMWMNIVFLQILSGKNILFEKLCGNSDGWIFFAAQTCFHWWENNIG